MRICFITNLYPPYARGGAERVVHEEAMALRKAGNDVFIITTAPVSEDGDASLKMTVEDGIRVYRFYALNLFFYGEIGKYGFASRSIWHAWDLLNPSAASVVARILRKERPQIVHTHQLKGLGFGIPRVIRSLKIRHVHTLHDVQLAVPSGLLMKGEEVKFTHSYLAGIYAAITRNLFGSPDIVISPSRFLMKFYEDRKFFPRSSKIILANPAPAVSSSIEHKPSKEIRFLFLGQIEKHKGIFLLIETFKKLLTTYPNARLEIVGDGAALKQALMVAGKEIAITFYGKRNPKQFAELFSSVEYTVVPSLCYENAPTVIVESFAHGVPVIAADIGGAAELIKEHKNGWKFEAGNADALLTALQHACRENSRWSSYSTEAKNTGEPLTTAHHTERLLNLYTLHDPAIQRHEPVVPVRYVPKVKTQA